MNNFSGADWQNFIYLLILLIILVMGNMFRPNLNLKKIAKYFLAWSIVAFIGILLYSYRFEFGDFKSRILGEINPSKARITKEGNIIIKASQDGHFYIDLEINSYPIRFMIDTGASDIVISLKEAKRIGIDELELNFNKVYQTANGKSFGANIILDEIKIDDIKFYKVPASVNQSEMGISLLGMSFLRQFKKYEFYQDQLELTL